MLVASKLAEVKVYYQGATVFREVVLTGEGGRLPEEIEVAELPLALYDPTARFRVRSLSPASAEVVVAGLRVGLHVAPKAELPPEPDREALKKVERRVLELESLKRRVSIEKAHLGTIQVPERPEAEEGKPPPASPIAARLALDDFVEEATSKRVTEERTIERELVKLREERDDLLQKIALASSARTADAKQITKSVVARLVQGEAPIEHAVLVLEYFVPGARWTPAYQCRLTRDGTEADVQLRALVCQRSGEDWRGVNISLSTAAPLSWTELPELSSQRIGKAQTATPSKRGFRPPPRGAASLFEDYDRDRGRAEASLPAGSGWSAPSLYVQAPLEVEVPTHFARGGGGTGAAYPAAGAMVMGAMAPAADYGSAMEMDDEAPREMEKEVSEERARRSRPAPMPAAAPAKSMAAPKMSKRAAPGRGGPRDEGGLSPEAMESAELVVYTSLRLAAPTDAGQRSRLSAVDRRAAYQESLARFPVAVYLDPIALVDQATLAARSAINVPPPPLTAEVRASAGHFDYAYAADAPVDVPSDGAFHSIPLGSRRSSSSMRYVVVPREDSSVFRIADLKNPIDAPLLAGPAELYVGGEYVLTTRIPTVGPRGKLELGLGVEQAIKCARNTSYAEKRSGSKVVATNELVHAIDISIANNLGREIEIEVRERIPQPADGAEVVVEEGMVEPAWEAYEQTERGKKIEGGRRWEVKVAAHTETKLTAEYVVKIYANNEIVGGNRREA